MTGEVTVAPSENLSRSTLWAAVVFGLVYPTILTWVYFSLLQEARPGVQQGVYSVGKAIQFGLPAIWAWRSSDGGLFALARGSAQSSVAWRAGWRSQP